MTSQTKQIVLTALVSEYLQANSAAKSSKAIAAMLYATGAPTADYELFHADLMRYEKTTANVMAAIREVQEMEET